MNHRSVLPWNYPDYQKGYCVLGPIWGKIKQFKVTTLVDILPMAKRLNYRQLGTQKWYCHLEIGQNFKMANHCLNQWYVLARYCYHHIVQQNDLWESTYESTVVIILSITKVFICYVIGTYIGTHRYLHTNVNVVETRLNQFIYKWFVRTKFWRQINEFRLQ